MERPDKAIEAFECLGSVLESFGLQESVEKSCPPSTVMIFLGLLYDTVILTVSIDQERLIKYWLSKDKARLGEVQSVIGKINFIVPCARSGRIFIARLLNFLRKFQQDEISRTDYPGTIMWGFVLVALYFA